MAERPERMKLPDFSGRLITLPDEPASWRRIKGGSQDILLLGLGPGDALDLPFTKTAIDNGNNVFWLEAPRTRQIFASKTSSPLCAPRWQEVNRCDALDLARSCSVYFYSPGLRLAPDFWSTIITQIELLAQALPPNRPGFAWLPGHDGLLLHKELRDALSSLGYSRICERVASPTARALFDAWGGDRPDFALSINFQGLDGNGHIFELCRELGIELAIWLVDNPWNLLSDVSLPWWREANIFITDASFIGQLKTYGAKNVWHLPLAASSTMLTCMAGRQDKSGPVFVGSSEFAEKRKFFSGIKIEPALLHLATRLLSEGKTPDFHWWQDKCNTCLWPGKQARLPSFGADELSRLRRREWLASALFCGLTIYGDKGWQKLLPDTEIMPPVDYYHQLPQIYSDSECVLNVTSLLLPQSLNQRHFDVWAAGGFLLTDFTAGLDIFPGEFIEPIILHSPDDFCARMQWLKDNPALKLEIAGEWRNCISNEHKYEHRIRAIRRALAA